MICVSNFMKGNISVRCLAIPIIIAVAALFCILLKFNPSTYPGEVNLLNFVHPDVVFHDLDSNEDGILTPDEFLKSDKRYRIARIEDPVVDESIQHFPNLTISTTDHVVNIHAFFQKLNLNSLTKDMKNIPPNQHLGPLHGLLHWSKPFKDVHNFSSRSFSIFLPPSDVELVPGSFWWFVEPSSSSSLLSSKRHFPTQLEEKFRPLFALLAMFHPRAFLWTRFGPQGSLAILRAVGNNFLDIVFRVHAEYQLNEPPILPFWFTPAQFSGRIIVNKDGSIVHYFHLEVPTRRKLNVDMEWLNGPSEYQDMEVDIGFIPQMELTSHPDKTASDILYHLCSEDNLLCRSALREIPLEDAVDKITQNFYSFTKVKYHNFSDAFHTAAAESKLVHGIVLWGSLDDQSC